jgi:hypothetical protein
MKAPSPKMWNPQQKPWAAKLNHAKILPAIAMVTAKFVGGKIKWP